MLLKGGIIFLSPSRVLKLHKQRERKISICGQQCDVSYPNGQAEAMYPDAQLVRRFTVVVISQILQKLSQIQLLFGLLPPESANLLNKGNRIFCQAHSILKV